MQYERRVIILFLANWNWHANEIAAALKKDFGQDAYALRTVQGWLLGLRRGRKNLYERHRSGRRSLDHIDAQILAALEKSPFDSCRSLGMRLGYNSKMVYNYLVDSIRFRSFHLRWVPSVMTRDLSGRRIEGARTMLPVLEAVAENDCHNFTTG
jgi:lambda repressor-like predicted transcriptional regulator